MKYGVGTGIINYDLLEELGFDYIELPGNQIAALTEEEFIRVKQKIVLGRVKCCGFNAALPEEIVLCGTGFDLEQAKVYAQILCKRGNELGITAIGIGSPKSRKFQKGDDLKKTWNEVETFMSMFADVAVQYNIIVMYESLNKTESIFGLKIREGVELVKRINKKNLKVVFDIYHMYIENESAEELLYALPYVQHVHIAERVGIERRYPSEALYQYYKTMIAYTMKSGYNKIICTEAFDGDIREGATRSLSMLKKIVKEVQEEV